jgi:hypothetical protein
MTVGHDVNGRLYAVRFAIMNIQANVDTVIAECTQLCITSRKNVKKVCTAHGALRCILGDQNVKICIFRKYK